MTFHSFLHPPATSFGRLQVGQDEPACLARAKYYHVQVVPTCAPAPCVVSVCPSLKADAAEGRCNRSYPSQNFAQDFDSCRRIHLGCRAAMRVVQSFVVRSFLCLPLTRSCCTRAPCSATTTSPCLFSPGRSPTCASFSFPPAPVVAHVADRARLTRTELLRLMASAACRMPLPPTARPASSHREQQPFTRHQSQQRTQKETGKLYTRCAGTRILILHPRPSFIGPLLSLLASASAPIPCRHPRFALLRLLLAAWRLPCQMHLSCCLAMPVQSRAAVATFSHACW